MNQERIEELERQYADWQRRIARDGVASTAPEMSRMCRALPELIAMARRVASLEADAARMKLPTDCRNRLKDEGKPYPKSSCLACRDWLFNGCRYAARTLKEQS